MPLVESQIKTRTALSWLWTALKFLAPLVASAFIAYGSVQFARGNAAHRLDALERDVNAARADHERFVTRDEFGLIRDDLKEIKTDVRELRREMKK